MFFSHPSCELNPKPGNIPGGARSALAFLLLAGAVHSQTPVWTELMNIKVDPAGGSGTVETCEFSADGSLFAAGNAKGEARIYRSSDGKLVQTIIHSVKTGTKEAGEVESVYFSPDGTLIATTGNKTGVRIFKVADASLVKELSKSGTSDGAAFSPNGKWYACQVGVFETTNWTKVGSTPHGCDINSFDFTRDSKYLVTGSCDQKLKLWKTSDWSLVNSVACGAGIKSARFSPDEKLIATGHSHPKITRTYSFPDLKKVSEHNWTGAGDVTEAVAWMPSGKYLLSGTSAGPAKMFIADGLKPIGDFPIRCEYIDVHGDKAIIGGEDGNVKMWKISGAGSTTMPPVHISQARRESNSFSRSKDYSNMRVYYFPDIAQAGYWHKINGAVSK